MSVLCADSPAQDTYLSGFLQRRGHSWLCPQPPPLKTGVVSTSTSTSKRELSCQAAVAQNQEEAGPKIRRPDTSGGRKSPTRRVGWTEIADQTRRVRQIAQRLLHVIATDRGSESITGPTRRLELSLLHVIATDRRSESITGPTWRTRTEFASCNRHRSSI